MRLEQHLKTKKKKKKATATKDNYIKTLVWFILKKNNNINELINMGLFVYLQFRDFKNKVKEGWEGI